MDEYLLLMIASHLELEDFKKFSYAVPIIYRHKGTEALRSCDWIPGRAWEKSRSKLIYHLLPDFLKTAMLCRSAIANDHETVGKMIQWGSDPLDLTVPMRRAYRLGRLDQVEWMKRLAPALANILMFPNGEEFDDYYGEEVVKDGTPIEELNKAFLETMKSSQSCDIRELKGLIRAGCDINIKTKDGSPVIVRDCVCDAYPGSPGYDECYFRYRLLIRAGIDVNMTDKDGQTCLISISPPGRDELEIFMDLIMAGADVNAQTKNGESALDHVLKNAHYAIWSGADEILIQAGAIESDLFALNRASYLGDLKRIDELIAKGVDLNQADSEGRTPLMWSARNGHVKCVEALIRGGADVHAKDNFKMTTLIFAVAGYRRYWDGSLVPIPIHNQNLKDADKVAVAKVLIKAKVDVNAKDESDQTFIDWFPEGKNFL